MIEDIRVKYKIIEPMKTEYDRTQKKKKDKEYIEEYERGD